MEFEKNDEFGPKRARGWSKVGTWAATVVLSALVGSGATAFVFVKELPANRTASPVSSTASSQGSASSSAVSTSNMSTSGDSIVQVVQKVKPAVMGVVNYGNVTNVFSQQSTLQETGVGSGVLFYKDSKYGYLVTNHHVVAGAAKVEVVTTKGVHIQAQVVGSDEFTDLAVVRIPVKQVANVTPIPFADSSQIQAGQQVIAIGNPMGLAFQDSVTSGIISATQRSMPVETENNQVLDYQDVIQTDAAINPGNSGGPLLNMQGQIVGINSSKIVSQDVQGMGFAIPSNEVQKIADELLRNGKVVHSELGIEGYDLSSVLAASPGTVANSPTDNGVYVYQVTSQAAKQAGLKQGDIIVGVDGHSVSNSADLRTYIFEKAPGQTVTLQIYRGNQKKTLTVKLEQYQQQPQQTQQSQPSQSLVPSPTVPSPGYSDPSQGGFGSTSPFSAFSDFSG